ncbi:uncharacterized protein LOC110826110 isoform X1 [Carica papaya]|uniref:uncharacterized protein LOC110826110 isoform X1 n=1 Tax=Carica papaya TaxID=3649 RepID=UPI000B8CE9B4|nr:uncharacterized protein LOC110826110 isoform X1 [Carica papaya]
MIDGVWHFMHNYRNSSMFIHFVLKYAVAASQIAFGFGGAATSMKHGVPKGGSSSNYSGSYCASQMKEYKEPWDYYSYYPVTLPLRRPYSGNPEILDEEEFGEVTETAVYNESSVNPALELGLMEDNAEPKMLFLQLPPTLPLLKRPAKANGHEVGDSSRPSGGARTTEKTCGLDDLPAGLMGKMLVYKSGAVKLKLGDTLYDVNPGLNCVFAQDVATINTTEKHCCVVGELNNRAIVTPDIDSVLNSTEDF